MNLLTIINDQRTAAATMNEIPTENFIAEQGATCIESF